MRNKLLCDCLIAMEAVLADGLRPCTLWPKHIRTVTRSLNLHSILLSLLSFPFVGWDRIRFPVIMIPMWFRREFLNGRRLLFNFLFYGSHLGLFAYGWYSQVGLSI